MRAAGFDHVLEGRAELAERELQIAGKQIAWEKPRAQAVVQHTTHVRSTGQFPYYHGRQAKQKRRVHTMALKQLKR